MRKVQVLVNYLQIRQASNPDQVPVGLDKSVAKLADHEITTLVGQSQVVANLWYFLNASTVNLIQHYLCHREPEAAGNSFDVINKRDS